MLAAVVLIAAAFLVRRNVLDDDDADADSPDRLDVAVTTGRGERQRRRRLQHRARRGVRGDRRRPTPSWP